jgi:hypothetical protein
MTKQTATQAEHVRAYNAAWRAAHPGYDLTYSRANAARINARRVAARDKLHADRAELAARRAADTTEAPTVAAVEAPMSTGGKRRDRVANRRG